MIRTFEVKYEFAETELRWQDFFFQGLYSQLIMWFESVQLHLPGESDSGSWLYPCHVTCITFQYASTCVHIDMKPEQKDQRFHNMTMTTQFTDMVQVITAAKKKEEKTMRTKDLLSWTSDVQNSVFSIKTESMTTMKIKYSQGIINKSANSPQRAPWCEIYWIKEIKVVQFCSLWLVAKLSWSN